MMKKIKKRRRTAPFLHQKEMRVLIGHSHGNEKHAHESGLSGMKGFHLLFVVLLNFAITAAQVVGGIVSGSLSLLSDALHNFSDGFALAISYFAIRIADRKTDAKQTFGYKRATIMAALLNASVLIAISVFLLREAYDRFMNPQAVDATIVIWVALIGLAANMTGVALLRKGSQENLNIRSSYIHLISDSLTSAAVIAGGVLMRLFGIYWVDPVLTVLISVYVIRESYLIVKDAVHILMQGTPGHINLDELALDLKKIDGVKGVHHMHVWSLDENNIHFEVHVEVADMPVSDTAAIRRDVEYALHTGYGIDHVTLQFEHAPACGPEIVNGHE